MQMLLWVDDTRLPPSSEWTWVKTVDAAKEILKTVDESLKNEIVIVDLDYDAGTFALGGGGGYIQILHWIEAKGIDITANNYYFRIHADTDHIGKQLMEQIIKYHNWNYIPYHNYV